MESILYNISQVLGITIIHSLWQGLLIWFVLRIALIAAPSLSPVKKYNLAVAAMLSIFVCFVYTLLTELHAYSWLNIKSVNAFPLFPYLNLPVTSRHVIPNQSIFNTIAGYLPYISAIYIAGLLTNLAKLGQEWNKIRLIKQSAMPAGQMQQFINSFSKKLDITKYIQINFSDLIDVPCMVGYLKPIILLPVSMATYLTACEIESILLHELSHIKRNDYIVNLLQQMITVVLFFNPFAQLINRTINRERENGCDDLVIEKTGKPLIYAKALLKLEETRGINLQLAMSATGKKYHLLNRIERIMKTKKSTGNVRHLLAAILLLTGGLCCIAWFNPKVAGAKITKTAKLAIVNNPLVTVNPDKKMVFAAKTSMFDTTKAVAIIKESDKFGGATDTSKRKKSKVKIIVEDEKGNNKEYNSLDEMPQSDKDEFFKQNPGFNNFMLDSSINKFYSSPQWKAQIEAMRRQGEEMRKQFNGPEWKHQMEAMQKQGEEWKKQFNSQAWRNQMEAMKMQGKEMRKHFNSPEWKKQMEKQGEEWKKQFNGPEWKKQMEDMQKQGEEWKKQFNGPEWKKQMEDMQKHGEEWKKQFNGSEWYFRDSLNDRHTNAQKKLHKKEKAEKLEKKEKAEKVEKNN